MESKLPLKPIDTQLITVRDLTGGNSALLAELLEHGASGHLKIRSWIPADCFSIRIAYNVPPSTADKVHMQSKSYVDQGFQSEKYMLLNHLSCLDLLKTLDACLVYVLGIEQTPSCIVHQYVFNTSYKVKEALKRLSWSESYFEGYPPHFFPDSIKVKINVRDLLILKIDWNEFVAWRKSLEQQEAPKAPEPLDNETSVDIEEEYRQCLVEVLEKQRQSAMAENPEEKAPEPSPLPVPAVEVPKPVVTEEVTPMSESAAVEPTAEEPLKYSERQAYLALIGIMAHAYVKAVNGKGMFIKHSAHKNLRNAAGEINGLALQDELARFLETYSAELSEENPATPKRKRIAVRGLKESYKILNEALAQVGETVLPNNSDEDE